MQARVFQEDGEWFAEWFPEGKRRLLGPFPGRHTALRVLEEKQAHRRAEQKLVSQLKVLCENTYGRPQRAVDAAIAREKLIEPFSMRDKFKYDPDTGDIISVETGLSVVQAPEEMADAYCSVKFGRTYFMAHRLAWYLQTGSWPPDEIDHKNRVKSDNRWSNLRDASGGRNVYNRPQLRREKRIGGRGIQPHRGGYIVTFQHQKQRRNFGWFRTKSEAMAAYDREIEKLRGDFAITNASESKNNH
jgi:hypothetical protein